MIKRIIAALAITILLFEVNQVNGHGILLIPPARSSAWREDPSRFPTYYGDNQMFCGGVPTQWGKNNGKCGICGEDYSAPKRFEKGGDLYRGFTVRTYSSNQYIDTVVDITANHKGYFEFRLCNVDNIPGGEATQQCLDQTVLADKYGRTKIPVPGGHASKFLQSLVIPPGFQCNHCVLQWKYNTGNSWGTDTRTGQSCIGCGPQEQFYGCSDIRIIGSYKREWSISAPTENQMLENKQPTIVKKEQYDGDEQTMVSKSLLKRLYNELKRMKEVEKQYIAYQEGKRDLGTEIANEEYEQREFRSENAEMDAREYLPQEVEDLADSSNLNRVIKK